MRCARAVRFRRAHPEVHIFGNDHDGWYASFPVQGRRGYEWYIYRENLGMLLNRIEMMVGPDSGQQEGS